MGAALASCPQKGWRDAHRGQAAKEPFRAPFAAVRPRTDVEDRMAGFLFRLEAQEGIAADPATLESAIANWKPGDSLISDEERCVLVGIRDDDADQPPVLIVEEAS
jgi:hypothetical protein